MNKRSDILASQEGLRDELAFRLAVLDLLCDIRELVDREGPYCRGCERYGRYGHAHAEDCIHA